ncbi:hypothetical protein V6Z11_D06G043800 [Gossypium hirsutum]
MGALVNTWSSIYFLQLNSKFISLLCMLSLTEIHESYISTGCAFILETC